MEAKVRTLFSAPGWPSVVDLKCEGGITIERKNRAWSLRLISVRAESAQDWRAGALAGNKMIKEAKVLIEIDGHQKLLRFGPFEAPVAFQGLRLHVEMVRALSLIDASAPEPLHFDARIAAIPEEEPWAPRAFRFPLPGHIWRANPCYGAWGALLYGDSSRYCDGFNLGVSADSCAVVAALPGAVKSVKEKKGLTTVKLEHLHGIKTSYANLDPRSIPPSLVEGAPVEPGDLLGKAALADVTPPHLYFSLGIEDAKIDPYPALVEAYLRENPDAALPFAGGHIFCQQGEKVALDASLSILRPGRKIASATWLLSDGSKRQGVLVDRKYNEPGFHAEELRILLDDGQEYRDAVQVRVFEHGKTAQAGFPGWLHFSPAKNIGHGSEVVFKLLAPEGFKMESVDFGDGSQAVPSEEFKHSYGKPGIYTVEARGSDPAGLPVRMKRFVRVA